MSSWTRARYIAPPSPAVGETPISSVNIATQAGSSTSSSSGRTLRTSGSGVTAGGPASAMSGCAARTARARPQCGSSRRHSGSTASAAPTMDEQRRLDRRARSAKALTASGPACTGTRLAPE
jgi:hypothetical protein